MFMKDWMYRSATNVWYSVCFKSKDWTRSLIPLVCLGSVLGLKMTLWLIWDEFKYIHSFKALKWGIFFISKHKYIYIYKIKQHMDIWIGFESKEFVRVRLLFQFGSTTSRLPHSIRAWCRTRPAGHRRSCRRWGWPWLRQWSSLHWG